MRRELAGTARELAAYIRNLDENLVERSSAAPNPPRSRPAPAAATAARPADMEALLLASITVNEDAMRELALQRGVAVKDYLASRKLPVERLYLGAAKAVSPDGDWKPRAELSLASR